MTDVATPTNATDAAAMATALQAYGAGRIAALNAIVQSAAFTGLVAQLQPFVSDQLPDCNTTKNVRNLMTCATALATTAPLDAAALNPPAAAPAAAPAAPSGGTAAA